MSSNHRCLWWLVNKMNRRTLPWYLDFQEVLSRRRGRTYILGHFYYVRFLTVSVSTCPIKSIGQESSISLKYSSLFFIFEHHAFYGQRPIVLSQKPCVLVHIRDILFDGFPEMSCSFWILKFKKVTKLEDFFIFGPKYYLWHP